MEQPIVVGEVVAASAGPCGVRGAASPATGVGVSQAVSAASAARSASPKAANAAHAATAAPTAPTAAALPTPHPTAHRYSGPGKPPFTYTELIELALKDKGKLTVKEIYQWIT